MRHESDQARVGDRLIFLGFLLFLIGLLTGFAAPMLANYRMGLSSHLEGVMNGMVLVLLGLVWPRLQLPRGVLSLAFWLAIYGTFANWFATLLAAGWGAGASMPIAAAGHKGTAIQELIITFLLYSLSFAMVGESILVLWGLRRGAARGS